MGTDAVAARGLTAKRVCTGDSAVPPPWHYPPVKATVLTFKTVN